MSLDTTNVRIAGACTSSVLGLATVGFAITAAMTASTVSMVACSILAVISAGASIASMTAWASNDSKDVPSYFSTMGNHMLFAIPAVIQFVGQVFVQALVQGITTGISNALSRKIGGPDRTVRVTS